MASPPVRLRVEFDAAILTESHRAAGLIKSWVHIKPDLHTVADLASHLFHNFQLLSTSPDNLVLSLDGFVLPSFESTCMFKDNDIISVANLFKEDLPAYKGSFEGGALLIESPVGENANSHRKRKHSNTLQEPKRKKSKSNSFEEHGCEEVTENIHGEHTVPTLNISHRKKKTSKRNVSDALVASVANNKDNDNDEMTPEPWKHRKKKKSKGSVSEALGASVANDNDKNTPDSGTERIDEDGNRYPKDLSVAQVNGIKEKPSSRSARRKKAKRIFRRQQKESLKGDEDFENEIHTRSPETETKQLTSDTEDGKVFVPVVDRPGHIRFEPIDAEQCKEESNGNVNFLQWNVPISKKKGQNWGREKTSRSDENALSDINEEIIAGDMTLECRPIDLESFLPLSHKTVLLEGDIIAYRKLELLRGSPELTDFRVGTVSSYDPNSMRIVLVPVPEHPFICDEETDDYEEDGTLKIDLTSLHDVRLFKSNSSDETTDGAAQISNSQVVLTSERSVRMEDPPHVQVAAVSTYINPAVNEVKAAMAKPPVNDLNVGSAQRLDPVINIPEVASAQIHIPLKYPRVHNQESAGTTSALDNLNAGSAQRSFPVEDYSKDDWRAGATAYRNPPRASAERSAIVGSPMRDNCEAITAAFNNPLSNTKHASVQRSAPLEEPLLNNRGSAGTTHINAVNNQDTSPISAAAYGNPVNNWDNPQANLNQNAGNVNDNINAWNEVAELLEEKKASFQKNGEWGEWDVANARRNNVSPPKEYHMLRRSVPDYTKAFLETSKRHQGGGRNRGRGRPRGYVR